MDLKELEAELARTRRKAHEWSAAHIQLSTDRLDQHNKFCRDQRDKAQSLQAHIVQAQEAAEMTRQRLASEARELQQLQHAMASANMDKAAAQSTLEHAQSSLQKQQDQLRRRNEELEQEQRRKQKKHDSLTGTLGLFSSLLGMRLTPGPEALEVAFNSIDGYHTNKEFTFAVKIQDNDTYTVTKCEPPIADMPALEAALNESNEFARFVKTVRSRFVEIARQARGLQ